MSTIDDLRSSLADDAASVATHADPARGAAVHRRIRDIRRRRRAGAVGTAVLAAVVAFGVLPQVADGPGGERDERPLVAGHRLAEAVEVLDFDYRFATSVESRPGAEELALAVDAADRRRVVVLAVDGLPAGATASLLDVDGELLTRVVGPSRVDVPVPVRTDPGRLSVRVDGGSEDTVVGIALYERTDELPAGLASDGVVFRERVADARLVGGAFVDPETGAATFTVDGPLADVPFARHCDSNGRRVFSVVEVDGEVVSSGRCSDLDSRLGEDAHGEMVGWPGRVVDGTHQVRIYTTDGEFSDEVVPVDDVVFGVAAYRSTPGPEVRGTRTRVARTTEAAGRLWELDRVTGRQLRVVDDLPVLVGFATRRGEGPAWLEVGPGHGPDDVSVGQEGGLGIHGVLWPGDTYDLAVVDARGRPADGRILVYRPVGP